MSFSNQSIFLSQENHLHISTRSHTLNRLQISNLHSRLTTQNISSLPHQFRRLYLSSRIQNLGLRQAFLFGNGRKNILKFLIENNILDQNISNLNPPLMHVPRHEFPKFQWYLIPLLQQLLKHIVPADGPQCGERQLLHWFMDIHHTIEGSPWYFDIIVHGSIDIDLDIIPGQWFHSIEVDDIGLHIDHMDLIGKRIEVLQPRTHCFHISTESFIYAYINFYVPTKLWSICL